MAHAEKCPVCEGSGYYATIGEGQQKCHGCNGKGWVIVDTQSSNAGKEYVTRCAYNKEEGKRSKKTFSERLAIGRTQQKNYSSYSTCMRCQLPWPLCDIHDIKMDETSSCFAICEDCWQELPPSERLVYYRALFNKWEMEGTHKWLKWPQVEKNILNNC